VLVNAAQGATRLEPGGSDSQRVRKEGDLTGPLATQWRRLADIIDWRWSWSWCCPHNTGLGPARATSALFRRQLGCAHRGDALPSAPPYHR